jgi:hypothetical protein
MLVRFFESWGFGLSDGGGDGAGFAFYDLVTEIGDLKLVLYGDDCLIDSLAVKVDAVGAAQVADDEFVMELNDATVSPRNLLGLDTDIAVRVATDKNDRSVQRYRRTFAYRLQMNCHSTLSALRHAVPHRPALFNYSRFFVSVALCQNPIQQDRQCNSSRIGD